MNIETARKRAELLDNIRRFFRQHGVLEVQTPALSHAAATECHIDPFTTRFHPDGHGESAGSSNLYLQSSPEFHMKRLLARGYPDIFQICTAFRNGEKGRIHNPEFTIVEWYRHGFSLELLMDETAKLSMLALGKLPVKVITYSDAFTQHTGINPLDASYDTLISFCHKIDPYFPPPQTNTDALDFIMAHSVQPALPGDALVFIQDFPADQAVFARLNPVDPRTALRFELFYRGIELCNAFEESCDWRENLARQEEENRKRSALGKPTLPVDYRFIDSLKQGIPFCSGAALGFDRLLMLGAGLERLDDVLAFGIDDA